MTCRVPFLWVMFALELSGCSKSQSPPAGSNQDVALAFRRRLATATNAQAQAAVIADLLEICQVPKTVGLAEALAEEELKGSRITIEQMYQALSASGFSITLADGTLFSTTQFIMALRETLGAARLAGRENLGWEFALGRFGDATALSSSSELTPTEAALVALSWAGAAEFSQKNALRQALSPPGEAAIGTLAFSFGSALLWGAAVVAGGLAVPIAIVSAPGVLAVAGGLAVLAGAYMIGQALFDVTQQANSIVAGVAADNSLVTGHSIEDVIRLIHPSPAASDQDAEAMAEADAEVIVDGTSNQDDGPNSVNDAASVPDAVAVDRDGGSSDGCTPSSCNPKCIDDIDNECEIASGCLLGPIDCADPVCASDLQCSGACTDTCQSSGCDCGERCGMSCGICPGGSTCSDNCHCICVPNCIGKQCGDDGCGGSCGSCTTCGEECQSDQCVFTACLGRQCGDDGCGGSCGTCSANETCLPNTPYYQNSSLANQCVPACWTDQGTGLQWQTGNPQPVGCITGQCDWQECIDYCINLNLCSHSAWRLPSINELRTVIAGCPASETGGVCPTDSAACTASDADCMCTYLQGPGRAGSYLRDELYAPPHPLWSATECNNLLALALVTNSAWVNEFSKAQSWHCICVSQ